MLRLADLSVRMIDGLGATHHSVRHRPLQERIENGRNTLEPANA
jgi:hypothetical protein